MIKSISVSILFATQLFKIGGHKNTKPYISSGFVLRLVEQMQEKPYFHAALKDTPFLKKKVFYLLGLQA